MFWTRKKPAPDTTYSVVGTVFVRDASSGALGAAAPHHLVRLPAGSRVKVLDKEVLRDRAVRVHIIDEAGRKGSCLETELWEHVGRC